MKRLSRFVALLLVVVMTVSVFASCKKPNTPAQTGEQKTTDSPSESNDQDSPTTDTDNPNTPEKPETEGLEYFPLPDGTYAVSAGKTLYLTDIVIPSTHDGKAVTKIVDRAFSDCAGLTSITIPNCVTSIGNSAFNGCNIQSAILPAFAIKYIPKSSLKAVVLTNGASISDSAFFGCKRLTSIVIPNSVTSIGDDAFYDCSSLTSIRLPNGVTSIGDSAFFGCSALTSMAIPSGVTSINAYAFYGCSSLTNITIPNGVTYIGDFAFYNCSALTDITIPDTLTDIGQNAFSFCSSITSITIPESVTNIGAEAFGGCYKLVEVYNKSALQITAGSTDNGYAGYYAKGIYKEPYTSK